MELNLPPKVRQAIYVIGFIGSPLMGYLNEQGVITSFQLGLYTVIMGAAFALAALNVEK